jgi:cell wall-associated NlpC family hydrolase
LGVRAFAAARAMVGVRFRPQGCDPATGLDCVGLVWAAYAVAGRRLARPTIYPMRGWDRGRIEAALRDAGFVPGDDARAGDVALIAYAAGQFHLGVMGAGVMVHAHAGLRRVVETPVGGKVGERWRLWC